MNRAKEDCLLSIGSYEYDAVKVVRAAHGYWVCSGYWQREQVDAWALLANGRMCGSGLRYLNPPFEGKIVPLTFIPPDSHEEKGLLVPCFDREDWEVEVIYDPSYER